MRRGFGSTVIERSIPFELGGKADISFPLKGVEAEFYIPDRHVKGFESRVAQPAPAPSSAAAKPSASFGGTALLVEDNLIIAMDSEHFLMELGAQKVLTASTVRQALEFVTEESPDYAVLDVNLGTETSIQVAQDLAARGIPFAFATGYGEASGLLEQFTDAPVLTKPYDKRALEGALARILG